jgi:hypothetical protein
MVILVKHYEEWKDLAYSIDEKNPYCAKFTYPTGDVFYIEPVFHLQMEGLKQRREDRIPDLLKEMERIVKKNHLVVFVGDEDDYISEVPGAIYLTIQDVCNPIHIFVEDKSRGSDYGD